MRQKSIEKDAHSPQKNFLKDYPMPPLPFERHTKKKLEKKSTLTDPITGEVNSTLETARKMLKIQEDIDKKLDELYQKTGWTPRQLEEYFSNSSNFNEDQLKYIQDARSSLMKSLKLPKETQEEVEKSFVMDAPSSKKGRRNKSAGHRRNWIQVK